MSAYRWHLTDPIPFRTSLRFLMEHKGWTFKPDGAVKSAFGERTDLLSSVAFWYQEGIATGQPDLPYGPARLPQGNAEQIEVDKALAEVRTEKGKASLSPELFWSKDVLLFEGEGEGARVEVPFDVPEDDDYELVAQLAQGATRHLLGPGGRQAAGVASSGTSRSGRAAPGLVRRFPPDHVSTDFPVGCAPRQGRHTLTFVCLEARSVVGSRPRRHGDLARTGPAAWAAAAR
jgi:hypothetical protein